MLCKKHSVQFQARSICFFLGNGNVHSANIYLVTIWEPWQLSVAHLVMGNGLYCTWREAKKSNWEEKEKFEILYNADSVLHETCHLTEFPNWVSEHPCAILCSDAHTIWQDSLLWRLGFWVLKERRHGPPTRQGWSGGKKTKENILCFVREFFWALSSLALWMRMTRRRRRRRMTRICRGGGSVLTKCTSMRDDESHATYYRSSEKIFKARKARG